MTWLAGTDIIVKYKSFHFLLISLVFGRYFQVYIRIVGFEEKKNRAIIKHGFVIANVKNQNGINSTEQYKCVFAPKW